MEVEAAEARQVLKDKDIREPLFLFLEEQYGKTRFIEEKNVGKSRADILMDTEDCLIGIEIKSDADSYQRLAGQVKDYDRFCDMNYVAVGSSHAMHIEEHVPYYWGIITIDLDGGEPDFYILRKPLPNPECKAENKVRLLWRRELVHIQEINSLPAYKEKSKAFVQKKILEKVPAELLNIQFCNELFERDYNTIGEDIAAYRKASAGKRASGKKRRTAGKRAATKKKAPAKKRTPAKDQTSEKKPSAGSKKKRGKE